jgi:hypothetical protein
MPYYEKHPALPQTDSEGKQTDTAGAQHDTYATNRKVLNVPSFIQFLQYSGILFAFNSVGFW